MDNLCDRLNKSFQKKRYRFITDLDSKSESSNSESPSPQQNNNNRSRSRLDLRRILRLKERVRRQYKFLTETEYSESLEEPSEREDSSLRKRERSPLANNGSPKKKIKPNEDGEIDLNRVVQDSLDFIDKMKTAHPANKKWFYIYTPLSTLL